MVDSSIENPMFLTFSNRWLDPKDLEPVVVKMSNVIGGQDRFRKK
jgi:hypothetical protein